MIARLMSQHLQKLGHPVKGQLIEVDRGGLVAGYVGQTAIKTGEAIGKALGGVLFVDEAYALTDHGENDYGQEAVDTLLKAMEDHRDDLIVIVAGYTELMKEFVHSNPGLESRFNRFMHFPDYTVEEMIAIFDMRCEKSGYELAADARELLKGLLALLSLDTKGFGNARGVRNLFERAVSAQADRLASLTEVTRATLMLLTSDDLRVAVGEEKAAEKKTAEDEKKADAAAAANVNAAEITSTPAETQPTPADAMSAPDGSTTLAAPIAKKEPETVAPAEESGDQSAQEGASTVEQLFRNAKPNQP